MFTPLSPPQHPRPLCSAPVRTWQPQSLQGQAYQLLWMSGFVCSGPVFCSDFPVPPCDWRNSAANITDLAVSACVACTLLCRKARQQSWMHRWKCALREPCGVLCCEVVLLYCDATLFYEYVRSFPFDVTKYWLFCGAILIAMRCLIVLDQGWGTRGLKATCGLQGP
jgi:hypothetical protein